MLKKQTVWLLTMLSLMIVLSVYYMTSPDMDDQAFINEGLEQDDGVVTTSDSEATEGEADVDIAESGQDEFFATLRLNIQDTRSEIKDRLDDVVASSSASTEAKNEALNKMAELDQLAAKEFTLEETIAANAEYQDVLVRSNGEKVQVHVKAESELTKTETVNIMQLVRDEFGEIPVVVEFRKAT